MSPVASKVVGAELVSGVLAIVYEGVGPGFQQVPILVYIVGVALKLGNGSGQRYHIACLFKGHIAPIHLTVGLRILAQVVGSKGFGPAT